MLAHPRTSLAWLVALCLLLPVIPAALRAASATPLRETMPGVAVTANVPHARESLRELRRPGAAQGPEKDRVIPFRRIPRPPASPFAAPATLAPQPSFPSMAPLLQTSTEGASFAGLGNPPHPGRDVVPPDTMGAAGPAHVVSLLNSEWGVFDKAGTPLANVALQTFWSSLGTAPGQPADFPFDPKILYDQYSGRFVAITLDCTVAPHSWVLLSVSASPNPVDNNAWYKWAIDADVDTAPDNSATQTSNFADYPGLGVDEHNIYVTANMFDNTDTARYSKVWVIPKTPDLLAGNGTLTWYEFAAPPGSGYSMQPAHSFGAAPAEYLLFEGDPAALRMARIDNAAGTPLWHSPAVVSVAAYSPSGDLPGAPQLGTTGRIDTADTRVLNAVYRNGSVWGTHHVLGTSGRVEVAWYRFDPATGATVAQGRVNDPSLWYYYPSIAVNADDVAAIGFSGSSDNDYVGAYYTLVWPFAGTDPVTLFKAGEALYDKTLGGSRIRWGDFSATSVDPVDDTSFWTLQEYAMARTATVSNWGTWWVNIVPAQAQAPVPVLTALSPSSAVAGGAAFTLTASGGNFVAGSAVRWNGSALATTFVSATELRATIPASALASVTTISVTVLNPDGGLSNSAAFAVTAPPSAGGGGGGCQAVARSPSGAGASWAWGVALLLPAVVRRRRRRNRICRGT
jgi:IPT/TIG domain